MKKLFAIFIILFSVGFSCIAEEFTSFLGIPFYSEKKDVLVAMEEKKWDVHSVDGSKTELFFDGRKYAGFEVRGIWMDFPCMDFPEDKLYSVTVWFTNRGEAQTVLEAMIEKYNLVEIDDYYYREDKEFKFWIEWADKGMWFLHITSCRPIEEYSTIESDI